MDTDPVAVQVLANYLHTVANEVEVALIRAAYSSIVKESFDCSAAIVSTRGEYWAQADAIPGQLGVLSVATQLMVQEIAGPLRPGDVLISNDPAVGCPHLNDFVTVTPIFAGGRLCAFISVLAHHTDVGGKAPGSMPADATELFQEGFRVPVQRLRRAGVLNDDLLRTLEANSRTPVAFVADLNAQLAASEVGAARVLEAIERFGADEVEARIEAHLDHTERLARTQLADFTPGHYSAVRFLDNADPRSDAPPAHITLDLVVTADGFRFDYSRSSDQLTRPLNAPRSNVIGTTLIAVRAMLDRTTSINGGLQRIFQVRTRRGSLVDPIMPAPVGARGINGVRAFDVAVDCLGQAAPDRAVASASGGTTMPYTWMAGAGSRAGAVLIDNSLTGGTGASPTRDGLTGVDNATSNATNLPVEVLEQDFPVIVERYEQREGSGGAGRRVGGNGLRRVVRFLEPGVLSVRGHGYQFPPLGASGGEPGMATRFTLVRDGEQVPISPQSSGVPTRPGDVFVAESPGGGGFGVDDEY